MSAKYFNSNIGDPIIYKTDVNLFCLPVKVNCGIDPNDIVTDCSEICTECECGSNIPFGFLFKDGDKFQFQLQVFDKFNTDPKNPTSGFGQWIIAKLCDGDGNDLGTLIDIITTRKFVGWNGSNSYQLYEIMFSPDLPSCIQVKFDVYEGTTKVRELCSRYFRRVTKEKTCLVRSEFNSFDCKNNYYGLPTASFGDTPFEYNNQIRLECEKLCGIPEIEETIIGTTKVKTVTKYNDLIVFNIVPKYAMMYINDLLFNGKTYIDGVEVDTEANEIEYDQDICAFTISKKIIKYCTTKNC
jgi:hypothetical protein